MAAWAAFAIAVLVMVAISLWRVGRLERAWWPAGLALYVIAALATIVLAGEDGSWTLALFGGVLLASDVAFLGNALAASLCTRAAAPPSEPAP